MIQKDSGKLSLDNDSVGSSVPFRRYLTILVYVCARKGTILQWDLFISITSLEQK